MVIKMKQLIFIIAANCVGKTTIANRLVYILKDALKLDGDWDANKEDDIQWIINSLKNDKYSYIIYCENLTVDILKFILDRIDLTNVVCKVFILTISKKAYYTRIINAIKNNERDKSIILKFDKILLHCDNINQIDGIKIDVSFLTPDDTVKIILHDILCCN